MSTILLVLHLLIAIFLVAFILLQRSSGGALDGLGGGNSASSFLTARGTGNFLTKATAILATLFFITSMSLSLYYKGQTGQVVSKSIVQQVPAQQNQPTVPTAE
ncbi:MAG: preprotein translocase subunit SecG [Alphaproteobacteria bacterium]|nr:preprotein translocase subunit SecG [Alphaproteobacteria bacterium]